MSELPENYERVLEEALSRKKTSPVRYECMRKRIAAVLEGNPYEEFADWTPEQAQKLQNDLDQQ